MRYFKANNFTQIFIDMLRECYYNYDVKSSPRGMETKALITSVMELSNPRNRLLFIEGRKYSLKYAIAEFIWYMSGKKDLEMITHYAPSIVKYSDDGKTINSGYGYKIMRNIQNGKTQIDYVIEKLKNDKHTRQAVIIIRDISDTIYDIKMQGKSKDIPCTFYMHFQIVNNELICIVSMRSQDLLVGKLYDVFCFTMIQEFIFVKLKKFYKNLKLGKFIMYDNNVHIYEKWYNTAEYILRHNKNVKTYCMQKMADVDINKIVLYEKYIRQNKCVDLKEIPKYWQDLLLKLREEE